MKAVICTKYGLPNVLKIIDIKKPVPKNNEVCVKVYATSVTASDCIIRGFKLPLRMWLLARLALGFFKPRKNILGLVFAGKIESIGRDVKNFEKGNKVFAHTFMNFGSYAEYTCIDESAAIAIMPNNMEFNEAVSIPYGGILALYYLDKGNIKQGQNILIYGASGSIGSMAVQIAKTYGAKITGVCGTTNIELVKSLGVDRVIDYKKEDDISDNILYDFIFDAVGKNKSSKLKLACKNKLSKNGKYISVDDGSPGTKAVNKENMITLKKLAESGQIKSIIDKCYNLNQIVEAHEYVDKGHKKGNVIIKV